MTDPSPRYADFLGTWVLVPESCDFEQGEPPREGAYVIGERGENLRFEIRWTDRDGKADAAVFEAPADGTPQAFAGGDLADALKVEVVSARDVRKSASYKGKERMITQLQLDDTAAAMRVTQVVIFPDGGHLANVSIYRRAA